MKLNELDRPAPPQDVRLLLLGTLFVQWYALAMAFPLLAIGSFSGFVVLSAGVVHLLLGLTLLAARRGIARGKPAALWHLRLISALIVLTLPAFAIAKFRDPGLDLSYAIFPALVTACGLALLLVTLRRGVRDWTGAFDPRA